MVPLIIDGNRHLGFFYSSKDKGVNFNRIHAFVHEFAVGTGAVQLMSFAAFIDFSILKMEDR